MRVLHSFTDSARNFQVRLWGLGSGVGVQSMPADCIPCDLVACFKIKFLGLLDEVWLLNVMPFWPDCFLFVSLWASQYTCTPLEQGAIAAASMQASRAIGKSLPIEREALIQS